MIEFDPEYCQTIIDRFEKMFGIKAKHILKIKTPRKTSSNTYGKFPSFRSPAKNQEFPGQPSIAGETRRRNSARSSRMPSFYILTQIVHIILGLRKSD
jgi:hypothetical protein